MAVDLLAQCSAKGDIDDLAAAAYPENRLFGRGKALYSVDLQFIFFCVDVE